MWRLEGWKNPYTEPVREGVVWNEEVIKAYEAGADAILTALWKMAEESPTKTFTIDARVVNVFGGSDES